jgi:NADH dehydrogenase
MNNKDTHHTVIIGAGFAGLSVANELEKRHRRLRRRSKITLIDKRVGQVYYPLLYEVATGELAPRPDAVQIDDLEEGVVLPFPVASRVLESERTAFRRGRVTDIDHDSNEVVMEDGAEIPYDSLVVAIGAKTATFGIEGVQEHAHMLRSIKDAMGIRARLDGILDQCRDGRQEKLEVAVVGAGPTGTEFIAELANCMSRWERSGHIKSEDVVLRLIEAGPEVLSVYDDRFRSKAVGRLMKLGVEIHTNTRVEAVRPDEVVLESDGGEQTLPADLVVWATGIASSSLPEDAGLPTDERGFIDVKDTLQVNDFDGMFALGDCATFRFGEDDDQRVPALAQAATKQAGIVAENIVRRYERRSLTKWHPPKDWVTVVPLGGKYAIADIGNFNISGLPGYAIRKFADLMYFMSVLGFVDALRVWFKGARAFLRND